MNAIVVLSPEELEALIDRAVRKAIESSGVAEDDKILTRREVAKMLRVDERSVSNWIAKRSLPGTKIGTRWRFSRLAVLRWKEKRA